MIKQNLIVVPEQDHNLWEPRQGFQELALFAPKPYAGGRLRKVMWGFGT